MSKQRGVALIEFAIVAPLLVMIVVGGIILGLATVKTNQITYATQQAASGVAAGLLTSTEAALIVAEVGGDLICLWYSSSAEEPCWIDSQTVPRVQAISIGDELELPFIGSVTPRVEILALVPALEP